MRIVVDGLSVSSNLNGGAAGALAARGRKIDRTSVPYPLLDSRRVGEKNGRVRIFLGAVPKAGDRLISLRRAGVRYGGEAFLLATVSYELSGMSFPGSFMRMGVLA